MMIMELDCENELKPYHELADHDDENQLERKMLKCRLCSRLGEKGIMAFSDEGLIRCLQQHIKKYLYITITMDDKLTKYVCAFCLNTLEGFHRFAIMASQSQRNLIEAAKIDADSKLTNYGLLHAYLTKETVINDHDYATSEKVEEDRKTPTETTKPIPIKKKRIRNRKKSATNKMMDKSKNPDENIPSLEHYIKNNNNEVLLMDADSNTHETLEIVVDPSLYLESSCESMENMEFMENENPSCLMCEFTFASSEPNENCNHENNNYDCQHSDSGNDDCSCPICGKTNFTQTNLRLHLRIHRPKGKHECDICKRIFKSYANLAQHKIYHNRVQFQCETCQRVYPTQSTLKAHAITHSDLRPHQCQLCEKSFKRNQDLKFHMNQHTGARPYKCIYCPKAFASSGNCFSHRKRMHPHEVERDRNFAATILR